tara:strand:+ start:14598 stop:15296 length:699 start_codon:yes stop_codon:yes gene_type:complete
MPSIELQNVNLNYPIYSNVTRSLKKHLFDKITGGNITSKDGIFFVEALKNISLKLNKGDRLGIQGNNGSGKTTLLRVLTGVLAPTDGLIKVDGSINAFIDIHYGMNMEATGIENIKIRCIFLGIPYKSLDSKVKEILEFSELGKYAYMPIKTYSSGMLMRLSFSITCSIPSDIILLDEWLSVGDENFREKANKKLHEMITSSSIFIISTHEKSLIDNLCNKKIELSHGEIVG